MNKTRIFHATNINYAKPDGIGAAVRLLVSAERQLGLDSNLLLLSHDTESKWLSPVSFAVLMTKHVLIRNAQSRIYVVHGVFRLRNYLFIILSLVLRRQLLVNPHCQLNKVAMSHRTNLKSALLLFLKLIAGRRGHLIFLSEDDMNASVGLPPWCCRSIVPNICDSEILDIGKNAASRSIKPTKPAISLVYIGAIRERQKKLQRLVSWVVEARTFGCPISLDLWGLGSEQDTQAVMDLIKFYDSEGSIKLKGFASFDDKVRALLNADFLILTSAYEGMPMVALESLALGRPVLATPGCNLSALLDRYKCGRTISSPSCLAAVIDRAINAPYEWHQMSEAALQTADKIFSGGSVALRTKSLYQSVLSK